jgi:hypothetical protein
MRWVVAFLLASSVLAPWAQAAIPSLPGTTAAPLDGAASPQEADPWSWLADLEANPGAKGLLATPGFEGLRILADGEIVEDTGASGAAGGKGLGAAWRTAFLGTPSILRAADLDGDGGQDVVAGTDVGIVAVDGTTWTVRWFKPMPVPVTDVRIVDLDADKAQDVVFGTRAGAIEATVAALAGRDGEALWTAKPGSTVLALATDGTSTLVATAGGRHMRLAQDGKPQWDTGLDLLPDTSAIVAGHYSLGHYLAASGDLTGDGAPDLVSAEFLYTYVSAVAVGVSDRWTLLSATDGSSGSLLWRHVVAADPSDYSIHALTDLDTLDVRGDGSADVTYTGLSFRYYYVPFAASAVTYEPFLRAVDGSGDTIAVVAGARQTMTPALPVEGFLQLDHTDIGADGREDAVVTRSFILGGTNLERYTFPVDSQSAGTRAVVSDVALPFPSWTRLASPSPTGAPRDMAALVADMDGTAARVGPDGAEAGKATVQAQGVVAMLDVGTATVVGTQAGLDVRGHDLKARTAHVPFFGRPIGLAATGAGNATLLLAWATDHALHVIDPLDGTRLQRLEVPGLYDAHVDADAGTVVSVAAQATSSKRRLQSHALPSLDPQWKAEARVSGVPGGILWFDGDGDGRDDALVVAGYDEGSDRVLRALRGADGKVLFDAELPDDLSSWPDQLAAVPAGGHDDLLVVDYDSVWMFAGGSGKKLWDTDLPDGVYFPSCAAGYRDSAGAGRAIVVFDRYEDGGYRIEAFDVAGGKANPVTLLEDASLWGCSFRASADGKALVMDITTSKDGDQERGIARVQDGRLAWMRMAKVDETSAPYPQAVAVDAEGGRVYARVGTVLRAHALADGQPGTEAALPSAASLVALLDIDHRGTLDLAVVTQDGMVRGMGEDLVIVPRAAKPTGVEGSISLPGDAPEGVVDFGALGGPDPDADAPEAAARQAAKGTPGLPAALALGAVGTLALGLRRRSRVDA